MHSCKCRACAANTLGCQSDVSFVVIAPLYIGYSHRFESRVVVFVKWNEPICLNSFTMWQWNNLRACIKWPSKRRTTEKNSQENVSLENISFISSAVLMTLFCFDFNAIQNARQLISSHKLKWRIVIRWINEYQVWGTQIRCGNDKKTGFQRQHCIEQRKHAFIDASRTPPHIVSFTWHTIDYVSIKLRCTPHKNLLCRNIIILLSLCNNNTRVIIW